MIPEEKEVGASSGNSSRFSRLWKPNSGAIARSAANNNDTTATVSSAIEHESFNPPSSSTTTGRQAHTKASPVLNVFARTSAADLALAGSEVASPTLNVFSSFKVKSGTSSDRSGGDDKIQGLTRGIRYLEAQRRQHETAGNWQEAQVTSQAIEKKKGKLQSLQNKSRPAHGSGEQRKSRFWLFGRRKSASGGATPPLSPAERRQEIEDGEAKVLQNLIGMGILTPTKSPSSPSSPGLSSAQKTARPFDERKDSSTLPEGQSDPTEGVLPSVNSSPYLENAADPHDQHAAPNVVSSNKATTVDEPRHISVEDKEPKAEIEGQPYVSPETQQLAVTNAGASGSSRPHRYSQSLSSHPVNHPNQISQLQEQIKALQSERDYWRRRAEPRKSVLPDHEATSLAGQPSAADYEVLQLRIRVHELEQELVHGR